MYDIVVMFFFFSSRRRHTRCGRNWSSDVCSSDLADPFVGHPPAVEVGHGADEYAAPCRIVTVLGGDDGVGGSVEPLRVEQRREPSREAGLGAVAGGDLAGVAVAAAVEAAGDRVP